YLPRRDVRVAHVGVGNAPGAEGHGEGFRLLLRSSDAAVAKWREPRIRDWIRLQESRWRRSAGSARPASPRGHGDVRSREQLLGKLCQERRPEWAGSAFMARVLRRLAGRHAFRYEVERQVGAEHGAAQGARRLLRVATRGGKVEEMTARPDARIRAG